MSATAIRTILRRHGLGPAPRRDRLAWKQFPRRQASGILACDFFTVETVWLKTLYVLIFMELSTRRVYLAGVSAPQTRPGVTQQARNLPIDGRLENASFLLRDRDAKFSGPFDEVFCTERLRGQAIAASCRGSWTPRYPPARSSRRSCSPRGVRPPVLATMPVEDRSDL